MMLLIFDFHKIKSKNERKKGVVLDAINALPFFLFTMIYSTERIAI